MPLNGQHRRQQPITKAGQSQKSHQTSWLSFAEGTPAHIVSLDEYYIDRYEVTNAQFATFLNALGRHRWACNEHDCLTLSERDGIKIKLVEQTYSPVTGTEAWPVLATWHGAQAYCQWLGKRLPTEAEWEKAARGTDGRKYPWGNHPYQGNEIASDDPPSAVGSHPLDLSLFGLFDTLGNAEEWVAGKVVRGGIPEDGITVRDDSGWHSGFRCLNDSHDSLATPAAYELSLPPRTHSDIGGKVAILLEDKELTAPCELDGRKPQPPQEF